MLTLLTLAPKDPHGQSEQVGLIGPTPPPERE